MVGTANRHEVPPVAQGGSAGAAWRRRELTRLALGSVAVGSVIVFAASRLVPIYLSVDGAHAVTDARALLGLAPRPPFYLPGFPAILLPFDRLGIDAAQSVAFGLALASAALFAALYLLAREGSTWRAAAFGALVGIGCSPVGEVLGWQGGATLLALAAATASFAAFMRWARLGGHVRAGAVGVAIAVALATHPFVGAVAGLVLLVQWLSHLARVRLWTVRGSGPEGLTGIAIAVAPALITLVLLLGSYLSIEAPVGATLRVPDLAAPVNVFLWATRETPALTALTLGCWVAALLRAGTGRSIVWTITLVFVLLPAILSGDASYQTRVAYLLPPVLAIGASALWSAAESVVSVSERAAQSRVGRWGTVGSPVILGILVLALGLPQRLVAAVPYYSTLTAHDSATIQSIAGRPGTVLAGWTQNRYWDGLLDGWYVEGLANRPAMGPTDPALTTRTSERTLAADAWELFSGEAGIEDGALQVAFGPPGWRADPAIAARIGGTYVPLIFAADASNDYGPSAAGGPALAWTVAPDGATGVRNDNQGNPSFEVSARLDGATARLEWRRDASTAPWTIWLWPAYGLPWRDVSLAGTTAIMQPYSSQAFRDGEAYRKADPWISLHVGGGGPTLEYLPHDPRYGVQAMVIHVPADAGLSLSIEVIGAQQAGATKTYAERALIAAHDLRDVLVWQDSGWADRFVSSACYAIREETGRLAIFGVTPACASDAR